ncbi:zinc dependent phospholipase C family protein [Ginsengibacter hankyongi]|uniref:Zinc dependent phospholipase C family protein n=1 Tax=Ginsengibacter hankyongi TaxID=2607284 RepID=A0A5J5IDT6_9BACT|nr:zinc dependent phospholipase C family protein [Ginsengibacter hankyongi]KAA9037181.1 zinc dependent phospholipase C family protein [Ginsengibacter hankyongi]
MKPFFYSKFLLLVLVLFLPRHSSAFGVLTHEAIIDASWDNSILPLLKEKYSYITLEQQKEAHAYAYGGAVTPDMGYYPFGSKFFTNLVHYVRSGDMVNALLKDARNINEYAFALGFLSHYIADNYGHPFATNVSVPLVYPKLEKKYGRVITYADNRISHMRMEFGFDVLEVAKGNYASQAYHDFIGFKVDTAVLSRAFSEIYGVDINSVFNNHLQLAVETFRWIVSNIFPTITKAAWSAKKNTVKSLNHSVTSKNFTFKMRRKQYNKQFGKGYKRPGIRAKILSFFIRALPKIGPLKALRFKTPTSKAEELFDKSFDTILVHFAYNLKQLPEQHLHEKDFDFDTGKPTADCEYSLADETYCDWLLHLEAAGLPNADIRIRNNIINFFHLDSNINAFDTPSKKCLKFYSACKEIMALH